MPGIRRSRNISHILTAGSEATAAAQLQWERERRVQAAKLLHTEGGAAARVCVRINKIDHSNPAALEHLD